LGWFFWFVPGWDFLLFILTGDWDRHGYFCFWDDLRGVNQVAGP